MGDFISSGIKWCGYLSDVINCSLMTERNGRIQSWGQTGDPLARLQYQFDLARIWFHSPRQDLRQSSESHDFTRTAINSPDAYQSAVAPPDGTALCRKTKTRQVGRSIVHRETVTLFGKSGF